MTDANNTDLPACASQDGAHPPIALTADAGAQTGRPEFDGCGRLNASYIEAMARCGIPARAAVRGRAELTIKRIGGPVLLNRTCQICTARRNPSPRPSVWYYLTPVAVGVAIVACSEHTASAIRAHCTVTP